MLREVTNNNTDIPLVSEKENQDGNSIATKQNNAKNNNGLKGEAKTFLGVGGLFAAASLLFRSDKGITYAQHVFHALRGEKNVPSSPNVKKSLLGAAVVFPTTLVGSYSLEYLDPFNYYLKHKDTNKQLKNTSSSEQKPLNRNVEDSIAEQQHSHRPLIAHPTLVILGSSAAIAIGSALVRNKNGITYAQKFLHKMYELEDGISNNKITPSRDESRLGSTFVFLGSFLAMTGVNIAAQKIYNLVVGNREKTR